MQMCLKFWIYGNGDAASSSCSHPLPVIKASAVPSGWQRKRLNLQGETDSEQKRIGPNRRQKTRQLG